MSGDELHFMTIAQVSEQLRTRQLSPVEYTRVLVERVQALNPLLDAFVLHTADVALQQARRAEAEIGAGNWRGPLHGIPFALKDIYDTAGIRTTAHSRQLLHNIPRRDAATVRRLKDAGAVLMGKLATHEFAHGGPTMDAAFPPARNPWDLACIPGGSSSGSGAAVAAGLVPAALGSDTGGSIRAPSGLCGVVGLKPTYGLVSKQGVIANSFTFDHPGPMTWTAEDCAIVLQALAGHEPGDPSSVEVAIPDYRAGLRTRLDGLRVGHIAHFYEQDSACSDEQRAAMQAGIAVLRDLGATVEEVRLRPLATYYDVKIIIAEAELLSVHGDDFARRPYGFSSDLRRRILPALVFSGFDYVNALRMRQLLIDEARPVFARYDALLTLGNGPSSKMADHRTVSSWESAKIATPFNVIGGGAISICNGFSASGLPMSMQIASRPFEDGTALAIAHAYEQATDWRSRRPRLDAGTVKPEVIPRFPDPERPEMDASMLRIAEVAAERSGFMMDETLFIELCEGLPHALAMAARLQASFARDQEPCLSFRMPR